MRTPEKTAEELVEKYTGHLEHGWQTGMCRKYFIAALTEALAQQGQSGWMPIESAPKDGTQFIGYSPTLGVMRDVQWSDIRQDFDLNGYSNYVRDWTHWQPQQPLPPAPQKGGENVD